MMDLNYYSWADALLIIKFRFSDDNFADYLMLWIRKWVVSRLGSEHLSFE